MSALLFILFFFLSARPSLAQNIPLFHQLLFAYHPDSLVSSLPPTSDNSSGLALASDPDNIIWKYQPQVLGVTSTAGTNNPLPAAVGGDGLVITLAVFGDSMIDTLGPGIPQLESALQTYYPSTKFNILNYGVGSSGLEESLPRLTQNYQYKNQSFPSLISQNPDLVIIESFAYNNYGNTEAGMNRYKTALNTAIATLKEKLPKTKIILAATIAPNSVQFADGVKDLRLSSLDKIEKSSTVKLYLNALINFANTNKIPLANAYTPSLSQNDGNLAYISPNDNLHPSGQGIQLFSQIIARTIFDNRLLD